MQFRIPFPVFLALALMLSLAPLNSVFAVSPTVFINEIHYDNAGTDTGEALEIAGPAGTDLTGWNLVLYNGSTGFSYDTAPLSGTITNLGSGFGVVVVSYSTNGLQNGSPDGIVLVDTGSNVIQFLSYEGTFIAADGPAAGMTSTDIGVSEASATPVGDSLQLAGTGSTYEHFTWAGPSPNTFGSFNTGQSFGTGPPADDLIINEFIFNHTSTDTHEFIEIFGNPNTDYSAFTILEIEGDSSGAGTIDGVFPVGTTGGDGLWTTPFLSGELENGTLTLLLVESFSGSLNDDLDTDNNGVFELTPWSRIVDDIAVYDGGASDLTYSNTVLNAGFDGIGFTVGGASRIPNGLDTDTVGDWVRNDFDGFGLPGFTGTPLIREAVNTPDATNEEITFGTYAIIHYFRDDGDYGDHTTGDYNVFWGLHLWGDIEETIDWTAPKPFLGEDEYGRFAWVKLASNASEVGFIVHRGDTKDGTDADRLFNPSLTPEIWLRQDDATTYSSQAEAQGYVTVRYHRDDGDYGTPSPDFNTFWGLHLWGDAIADGAVTDWPSPRPFDGINDYGAFWQVPIKAADVAFNYIIHRGDAKDPGPDQSFIPFDNATVWIQSGDEMIYPSRGAAENTVILHYHRADGDYGNPMSPDFNDFWGMHVWAGAANPNPTWPEPLRPAAIDIYGPVFNVPLVDNATELAYILHRGDEMDPGSDQFLMLDKWGYEVWQLEGEGPNPVEPHYVLPVLADGSTPENDPPTCDANGPYTAECLTTTTPLTLDGTGSSDPDNDPLSFSWASSCPGASFDDSDSPTTILTVDTSSGSSVVCDSSLTVDDGYGGSGSCSSTVTITDTTPPSITCPSGTTIECDQSTDPSITGAASATDVCDPNTTITFVDAVSPDTCSEESTITRTWTATDASGNSSSCAQTIEVLDTTPPDIQCNAPAIITPPDAPISFTATATDTCTGDPSVEVIGYDCFFFTKKGKRIDRTESCIVEVNEDTVTIVDSGGVNDNITWTVRTNDNCGNIAESTCSVNVVGP